MSKDNHGQSPASWSGTFLIISASIISTFGLVQNNWNMFWAGIILTAVSGIIWIVWEKLANKRKNK